MNTNSKPTELGPPLSNPHERNEERSPAPYRPRVGADPIHEAFAEHRKVLAQRDELVAALQAVEAAQRSGDYLQAFEQVRAALAKVAA
jgi:hypothetical protein